MARAEHGEEVVELTVAQMWRDDEAGCSGAVVVQRRSRQAEVVVGAAWRKKSSGVPGVLARPRRWRRASGRGYAVALRTEESRYSGGG